MELVQEVIAEAQGLNVPVNGAVPVVTVLAPASENTVFVKLSPEPPA